jgi:phosphoesterase, MJ0936 family
MRVGIISDTHIDKHPQKIEDILKKYFQDVDFLIHAGDYKNPKVVCILKEHGSFAGVWGNVDKNSVRELLNEKEIVEIGGYKIGIFHGHGDTKTTVDRAYDKFRNEKVDIIIFGHSHQPAIITKTRVLMLNPGSISYKRKERWYSYIILDLKKDGIDASIRFFPG